MGVSLEFPSWLDQCECGRPLDNKGYLLITCKLGAETVWTHECVADAWSELLRELGVQHKQEPRNRYVCSDDGSDIIMFDSDLGLNEELDIYLAHPWSKSVLTKAARNEGAAA